MQSFPLSRKQVVLLAVLVEGGLGLTALLAGWMLGLPVGAWINWSVRAVWWGLAGGAALLILLWLCRRYPFGPVGRLMRLVDGFAGPLFGACRWPDLLLISALAGIGEELFFRGFLQDALQTFALGWSGAAAPWLALAVTSVLFGFAHCVSREYVVFAALLGALLGFLALATGSLLAAIVAHAAYDFVALLVLTQKRV